jgi:3-oxoacyl-[acyl-carrier-protein] synthase III
MDYPLRSQIGICGIGIHEPRLELANAWFKDRLTRKFVQHTGTTSRRISLEDEVAMGAHAVARLSSELRFDVRDCAGLVFVSPSYIPVAVADKYLDPESAGRERLRSAARSLAQQLGMTPSFLAGSNWFCSGYAKAMETVQRVAAARTLRPHEFLLIVTAGRISRITNFDCAQTAPLFGDMATATLLARTDQAKYPVHYALLSATAEKEAAPGAFFDFSVQENVLIPTEEGGESRARQRVVFSLNGLGIADVAPRAMAAAVVRAVEANGIARSHVSHVVPHQAGAGIVRLAGMKLEQAGIRGEVVNGITGTVGNVSSSSIPYALKQTWGQLGGVIACPTAAVGSPGRAEVSSGCILLQATTTARQALRKIA